MKPLHLERIVYRALREDIGTGDITSEAIVPFDKQASGVIVAKASGCIAGTAVARCAFELLDSAAQFQSVADGTTVNAGDEVATIHGSALAILQAERVALNFLQHLSGIATATVQAVQAATPYKARIVDTRKTTPGLRVLEKAAVRAGGGYNHRFGLYDAVMLKENHLAVAGGITPAVSSVRAQLGHMVKIELEIERLEQIPEALANEVDVILLDNMSVEQMKIAVQQIKGHALTEASGGLRPEHVADVAACGVDIISLGWITHSVPALDLSLRIAM